MPKPTQAELLQRYPLPVVIATTETTATVDKSANTGQMQAQGSKAQPRSFELEASDIFTSAPPARGLQLHHNFTSSPSSCPSHSLPFSFSSVAGPRSRSSSDDGDFSGWSEFEFKDRAYRQMCNPSEAKALSIATGRFYAITSRTQDDLIPGDEPQVDGMILHGYTDGKPVYYKYSGIHADLKAIETVTVFGPRYIRQPVESCFGRLAADLDGDSGYASLQESESTDNLRVEIPPNRLFSNEWFKVGKSSLGGYGIFASKNIKPYTSILLEQPFIRLKNCNALRQRYDELSPEQKFVFDGLHAYAKDQSDELVQKANANSFMLRGGEGILAIASNFNHACHMKRNTQYHWDHRRHVMVFTTDSPVAEGEELLISYGQGRMVLQEKFGFLCNCGACDGPVGWSI